MGNLNWGKWFLFSEKLCSQSVDWRFIMKRGVFKKNSKSFDVWRLLHAKKRGKNRFFGNWTVEASRIGSTIVSLDSFGLIWRERRDGVEGVWVGVEVEGVEVEAVEVEAVEVLIHKIPRQAFSKNVEDSILVVIQHRSIPWKLNFSHHKKSCSHRANETNRLTLSNNFFFQKCSFIFP